MDKMTMAHEYALKMLENLNPMQMEKPTRDGIVYECFELAEAMQAEADKREKYKQDKAGQGKQNYEDALDSICLEKWQPDWSQAPSWASWFAVDYGGRSSWYSYKPYFGGGRDYWSDYDNVYNESNRSKTCKDFGYSGGWQDSLRNRPEGK